ncbi:hypothetical protein JCM3775_003033 [Rhodotorula graminis]|uniref:Calnexin n=1 Tax=Rhodotorula graminis (strain WP1) TaxID=578459 RepID=A0A194S7R8_RHOGW|nr:uncharacterized protein RHOBADRAFT_35252 [Rhodotorula graminis WP1]KPV76604.1 hypothetical protein RHOBADRAFT_35252 [Rhodotorula graminis WP1]
MKYALLPLTVVSAIVTLVSAESAPAFTPTSVKGIFVEQFDTGLDRWSPSKATKTERDNEVFSYVGKWSVEEPSVYPGIPGDEGLVLKSKAAHHAISAPLDAPFDPKGKPLVLSYEVKLQNGLDCGGAYIKLLTESAEGIQAEEFSDKTPYTIMFGPDRCGSTSKVHFIFRHVNPITGEIEEKHLTAPPSPRITKTTAVYTLVVRPDQTFEISINGDKAKSGSLLEDFTPAVNPPIDIDDPNDKKPSDWVETPKISDPHAVKPADWDEDAPATIPDPDAVKPAGWLEDESPVVPDPDAVKPDEWSDEDDGDWVAPLVSNPKCEAAPGCGEWKRPEVPNPDFKGKWFAPLVDNPDYKGPWAPRKIANPNFFADMRPSDFSPIGGVGFELWSMTDSILFDNIFLSDSEADLETFLDETYRVKAPLEAALEAKDKPAADEHDHDHGKKATAEPDLKADPVAWAKFKAQQFLDEALVDPKRAFVDRPLVGGALGLALAMIVGLAGVILSLALPAGAAAAPASRAVADKVPSSGEVKKQAQAVKDKASTAVADFKAKGAEVADDLKKSGEPTAVGTAGELKVGGEKDLDTVADAMATQDPGVRTRAKARKSREGDESA